MLKSSSTLKCQCFSSLVKYAEELLVFPVAFRLAHAQINGQFNLASLPLYRVRIRHFRHSCAQDDTVTVFAHGLHMHENGQRLETRQYRNSSDGQEVLVHSVEVEYYSFLQAGLHVVSVDSSATIQVSGSRRVMTPRRDEAVSESPFRLGLDLRRIVLMDGRVDSVGLTGRPLFYHIKQEVKRFRAWTRSTI